MGNSYLGNEIHEESTVIFGNICNRLFSAGDDGFETREMRSFYKLSIRYSFVDEEFHELSYIHIPRTQNKKVDSLVRSARKQPSYVVHIDAELPL